MHRRRSNDWFALLVALMGFTLAACISVPRQQSAEEAIDDGVVTAKVQAALFEDPVTSPHRISAETFKGMVQLRGFVESDTVRERAVQLARNVRGVKGVRDALEVRTRLN
jgi:osmotically-inducible protein OsmY